MLSGLALPIVACKVDLRRSLVMVRQLFELKIIWVLLSLIELVNLERIEIFKVSPSMVGAYPKIAVRDNRQIAQT